MISNPPFSLRKEIIKRSFELVDQGKVKSFALLLRLATLETEKRAEMFEQGAGKVSFSFTFKIEIKKFFFDDNQLKEVNWEFITTLSVLAMAVIALALIFSGAMAGIGTLIALFSMLLVS